MLSNLGTELVGILLSDRKYSLQQLYNYFIPYENLKFKYLSKNNYLYLSSKLLNKIIKLNAIIK